MPRPRRRSAITASRSRSIARSRAGRSVATAIHPAAILTPMWEAMLGDGADREARMAALVADTPLRRFGTPTEVAAIVVLLAVGRERPTSPAAEFDDRRRPARRLRRQPRRLTSFRAASLSARVAAMTDFADPAPPRSRRARPPAPPRSTPPLPARMAQGPRRPAPPRWSKPRASKAKAGQVLIIPRRRRLCRLRGAGRGRQVLPPSARGAWPRWPIAFPRALSASRSKWARGARLAARPAPLRFLSFENR